MKTEEIVEMFNAAGESAGWKPGIGNPLVINYLTHFAKLVAENEREACAKVCEASYMGDNTRDDMEARRCAYAIRARGEK